MIKRYQLINKLTPAQLMLSGHPLNILVKNLARGGAAAALEGALRDGFLGGRGGAEDAPALEGCGAGGG